MAENSTTPGGVTSGDTDRNAIRLIMYLAYSGFLPAICAFGILGNILNLMTLRSPALQTVSYIYLRALALADLICMFFILGFVSRQSQYFELSSGYSLEFYVAHMELPFINYFSTAGVYIIVALTVERYVSVVWPMFFHRWNKANIAKGLICGACVTCFVLYMPMCWRSHVAVEIDDCPKGQRTQTANCSGQTKYKAEINDDIYHANVYVGYKYLRETLTKVMPIAAMSYFNIHIIVKLRIIHKTRSKMTNKSNPPRRGPETALRGCKTGTRGRDDQRLLLLLSVIVVLFFVCNVPAAINLLFIRKSYQSSIVYQTFRATANVLEIANHAVNFYIFCCCSRDYRQEFLKTFPLLNAIRATLLRPLRSIWHFCRTRTNRRAATRSELGSPAEEHLLISDHGQTSFQGRTGLQPNTHTHHNQPVSPPSQSGPHEEQATAQVIVANGPSINCSSYGSNCVTDSNGSRTRTLVFQDLNLDQLPETKLTDSPPRNLPSDYFNEIFV